MWSGIVAADNVRGQPVAAGLQGAKASKKQIIFLFSSPYVGRKSCQKPFSSPSKKASIRKGGY